MFYDTTDLGDNGIQGFVYQARQCNSSFSRGQFTQTLQLVFVEKSLLLTDSTPAQDTRESAGSDTSRQPVNTPAGGAADTNRQAPQSTAGDFSGDFINADRVQTQQNQSYADDDRSGSPARAPTTESRTADTRNGRSDTRRT